jgi:5-methylcytosine-specific restriction endonuclease McrA
MESSFRDYYSWTFEDFFNELKRIGYGIDYNCIRYAKIQLRQSASHFTRDFRKKYLSSNTCCKNCGSKEKIEVDHIVPISAGGKNEESNLQFLCRQCHKNKTNMDYYRYKLNKK